MKSEEIYGIIEEIQRLLKECVENEKINQSFILKRRVNYIYSTLEANPICLYKYIEEIKYTLPKIEISLEKIKTGDNIDESIYLRRISMSILKLYNICRRSSDQSSDYNSEKYYTQQIKELQEKETALNKELLDLKRENATHVEQENELNSIKEQIKQYEAEKDELKKKLDARENIKERIYEAFNELKKHISHLSTEKTRLNWMFHIYAGLSCIVFVALVVFEYVYLSKWEGADKLIDYLPFYLPVPIVGGLLWLCISQMNRAQRQLIQVANALHHIDYIEGLLLAINHISADVNSASEKICNVLDHLIRNHMLTPDGLSEQYLEAEISKDNINLHTFINLAKEVKDVIK